MTQRRNMWVLVVLLGSLGVWAQNSYAQDTPAPDSSSQSSGQSSGQSSSQSPSQTPSQTPSQGSTPQDSSAAPAQQDNGQPQEPTPAYGQQSSTPPVNQNPPLTSIDLPSLEPHSAPLSYLQPGATFSETADSNVGNELGSQNFRSVSRALGSLLLNRVWSHYNLGIDYLGGAAYYDVPGFGWKMLQQADVDQKITWKRGQLEVRDSFSYLPEGNFGGSYGSLGSQGIGSLGGTAFGILAEGSLLGALGEAPRILNVSMAEVQQTLTPKSAITATGGYAFLHFYGNDVVSGAPYIGSSQVSGQVGYNRVLSAKTQVALAYAYQGFDFSVLGSAFHSHIIQAIYGHQITGRMDFLIGAGPQITLIELQGAGCSIPSLPGGVLCELAGGTPVALADRRIGVAGRVRLRYKFPKTLLEASYLRYETSGSGLFAGAQTDTARVSADRPLSRVWSIEFDAGYARNSRLQALSQLQLDTCGGTGQPLCPGTTANIYDVGFAGVAVHRPFGRTLHAFASYQFSQLAFDQSYCSVLEPSCSRIGNRQTITIGLDWIPRPVRID
jgi:hypothetical protein